MTSDAFAKRIPKITRTTPMEIGRNATISVPLGICEITDRRGQRIAPAMIASNPYLVRPFKYDGGE
jgi:hypothetical protein